MTRKPTQPESVPFPSSETGPTAFREERGNRLPSRENEYRNAVQMAVQRILKDIAAGNLLSGTLDGGQNLLGQDPNRGNSPGEESSGTGSFIWSMDPSTFTLSRTRLAVGDVVSFSAEVKSDTGADRVRADIRFRDSGGTIISPPGNVTGNEVMSSTYERSTVEDVEVPAGAVGIEPLVRNRDQTETAFARRIVLNRGPVILAFHSNPFRYEQDSNLPADVDVDGDIYVPSANAPKVGTKNSPSSLSKRWWFAFAAVQAKLTSGSVEDLSTTGWSITPGSGDGVEKTGHLTFALQPGVTITSVTMRMRRETTSDRARFFLYRINDDSATSLGSAEHGTTGWADVTLSGLGEPVNTDEHFYLQILLTSTTNPGDAEFSRGHVAYTMASYADTL